MKHPTRSHEVHSDADPLLWPHCGHAGLLVPDDKRIGSELTSKDGSALKLLGLTNAAEWVRGGLCADGRKVDT